MIPDTNKWGSSSSSSSSHLRKSIFELLWWFSIQPWGMKMIPEAFAKRFVSRLALRCVCKCASWTKPRTRHSTMLMSWQWKEVQFSSNQSTLVLSTATRPFTPKAVVPTAKGKAKAKAKAKVEPKKRPKSKAKAEQSSPPVSKRPRKWLGWLIFSECVHSVRLLGPNVCVTGCQDVALPTEQNSWNSLGEPKQSLFEFILSSTLLVYLCNGVCEKVQGDQVAN